MIQFPAIFLLDLEKIMEFEPRAAEWWAQTDPLTRLKAANCNLHCSLVAFYPFIVGF